MSQRVTRKGSTNDEKEKGQTDSPVRDTKKKVVVSPEKAAEKPADKTSDKSTDKKAEKPADKAADKSTDKKAEKLADKAADKSMDKKAEKPADKEKTADKSTGKKTEQTEKTHEKNVNIADKDKKDSKDSKVEKNDVGQKNIASEKNDDKLEKNGKEKEKERSNANANGNAKQQNGSSKQNGCNGSPASVSGDDDDVILVVDERDDEAFPELRYEESDEFEPPTPEGGRSFTRRSQVKATRTPETPRPPSDKQEKETLDESKDSKVLKLKEDANSDRKLRSADAPKEDPKKTEEKNKEDAEKKENGEKIGKLEVEVTVEIDNEGEEKQRRKEDTNYSKSRVKVSPYRRSMRLDQTTSSVQANYTGNNTTMEMDITESSFAEEPSLDDLSSSYLSAVRSMRGRRSYKQLKELNITRIPKAVRSPAPAPLADSSRPTGTVVGRKRKPDADDFVEIASEAGEISGKRMRLLDRLARPFRRVPLADTSLHSEIVGINTDLPLTTPIITTETFDPETLKPSAVPLAPAAAPQPERDGKRCVIM